MNMNIINFSIDRHELVIFEMIGPIREINPEMI